MCLTSSEQMSVIRRHRLLRSVQIPRPPFDFLSQTRRFMFCSAEDAELICPAAAAAAALTAVCCL